MLIHCPECGKEVDSNAMLCPYCGYSLNNMPAGQVSPYPNQYQNQTPNPYAGQYQNPAPNPYAGQYQNPVQSPYPNQYQNPTPNPYPNQYQNPTPFVKPRASRKGLFIGIAAAAVVVAVAVILIVVLGGGKYYRGYSWDMTLDEIAAKEARYVDYRSSDSLTLETYREPDSNFADPEMFVESEIEFGTTEQDGKQVIYGVEVTLDYKYDYGKYSAYESYLQFAKKKWGASKISENGDSLLIKRDSGYIVMEFYSSRAYMTIVNPKYNDVAMNVFY